MSGMKVVTIDAEKIWALLQRSPSQRPQYGVSSFWCFGSLLIILSHGFFIFADSAVWHVLIVTGAPSTEIQSILHKRLCYFIIIFKKFATLQTDS